MSRQHGAVVQLVRMPACHAGGHGFKSRRHRQIQQLPKMKGAQMHPI